MSKLGALTRRSASGLVAAGLLAGCFAKLLVPAEPMHYEFDVKARRAAVFDALLSVAHYFNLSVDVLEKDSGFIQFRISTLTAEQLDEFCAYPYVKSGSGTPVGTFQSWHRDSLLDSKGGVRGDMSLNVLVSDTAGGSRVKIRSTWIASDQAETHQVNSRGIVERRIESRLLAQLGLPPPHLGEWQKR